MIWITRPKEDGMRMQEALSSSGVSSTLYPLVEVVYSQFELSDFHKLELERCAGIIATSRHGLLGLYKPFLPTEIYKLPLYTVGVATGAVAKDIGFEDVRYPPIELRRGAEALVPLIEAGGFEGQTFLLLRGDEMAFDLSNAFARTQIHIKSLMTYRVQALDALSSDFIGLIERGKITSVALLSPRTARVYCQLMEQAELLSEMKSMKTFFLSRAIYEALNRPLDRYCIALKPTMADLVDLIVDAHQ